MPTPNTHTHPRVVAALATLLAGTFTPVFAQTVWDGGGLTDTSWGTAANWNNDTLPAFNGADSLTVSAPTTGNTALSLGADRSIGRITFGGGATAMSLSGNTLRLNSTTTSAATGAALWNANTADNVSATVNSNLLLQNGTAGNYTGFFRENVNSSGGTFFNGSITQGSGENWTLRFSRSGARGVFYLGNASNSISAIRNDGADVYSEVVGAFGGAALTLSGGFTGARTTDHHTTAINNNITVAANSSWVNQVQTRLTGSLTQSTFTLSYGTGIVQSRDSLTRLEYSGVTGTGATIIAGGTIAPSSMSQFASGTLSLGSASASSGVLVLSGQGGNSLPTWSDFAAARTYNQAGGANTWRIDAGTAGGNSHIFGGFAARGADLVIPSSGGGLSNATFARSFQLGSSATLNGAQYADRSVTIQTDIAYGSVAGANRFFAVAGNSGTSKSNTQLSLSGPVHELSGQITGDSVNIYPIGLSSTLQGIVRISNSTNNLTGTSRWIIGGNRSTFTTQGGGTITAVGNMADQSTIVAIFTSDGAFGGATEVNVSSQTSSATRTSGTLLFEDVNASGNTVFTRNINLQNITESVTSAPAWGSYAGDVVYTGTATLGGAIATVNNSIIHVQAGTMSLGVNGGAAATITNNRTAGTTHNKSGAGLLSIDNLTVNGTQASNSWNVREGTLRLNTNLAGSITVSSGATLLINNTQNTAVTFNSGSRLGGSGTYSPNLTAPANFILSPGNSPGLLSFGGDLSLNGTSVSNFEIDGASRGSSYDAVNVTGAFTYGGVLNASVSATFASNQVFNLFDFGSRAGVTEFSGISISGSYLASLNSGNGFSAVDNLGNTWSFNHGTGELLFVVGAIPEPSAFAALAGLGALGFAASRRRRRA